MRLPSSLLLAIDIAGNLGPGRCARPNSGRRAGSADAFVLASTRARRRSTFLGFAAEAYHPVKTERTWGARSFEAACALSHPGRESGARRTCRHVFWKTALACAETIDVRDAVRPAEQRHAPVDVLATQPVIGRTCKGRGRGNSPSLDPLNAPCLPLDSRKRRNDTIIDCHMECAGSNRLRTVSPSTQKQGY